MRRTRILFSLLFLATAACTVGTPSGAPTGQATLAAATSTASLSPAFAPTPTYNPPPSDLPFTIDCSALPLGRQKDCDAFLEGTRDRAYPILQEMTGVNLSQCYKSLHYIILPTDPAAGAGGFSTGDTITYNERYSIDLKHPYDVHEILHSASMCAGALDVHVFHGFFMNAAWDRLGVHEIGYFEDRSAENLTVALDRAIADAQTASGVDLTNVCWGILGRKMTIAYFDLGADAFRPLYRSTIYPPKNPPGATMTAVWGGYARAVEALMETLRNDFKYIVDVPSCGLPGA